jgi:hypothetical protein
MLNGVLYLYLNNMPDTNRTRHVSRGMSLPSVLLLIFIILKLTGTISWSWLWILSPLWIGAILGLLFFLVIGIILLFGIIGILDNSSNMILGIKRWFRNKESDYSDV